MIELQSFVEGGWFRGSGNGTALLNPATEEVLAQTSTEGLNAESALAFARDRGGAALRALTFGERAELLRAMSRVIHQHRDSLLDLAMLNGGCTRSDAKFDVDGASGTLAFYADLGKELGPGRVLLDGDAVQLSRGPRLVGQHVMMPRRGVALFVNAFNFPAWGLGEKAACALLAGMPVVVKPATSTALLTYRIVELIVEANILPAGVLSLVAGAAHDITHHLRGEDVLSFTGGGQTAATLRALPAVVRESVRINVEADSLNAAVLGADAEPGGDTWIAFLRDVARDITQKTGQKCTAIRRVFVPERHLEQITEELRERLKETVVGNPTSDGVTMGPVATKTQQQDVLAGLELLGRESERVLGADPLTAVGAPPGKGFYVAPHLFVQRDPLGARLVHEHEVFGPSATIMPYRDNAEVVTAVRKGGGGLVSSLYADDRKLIAEVALGIASSFGRVCVTSSKVADQAPGPGTVLPQSLHGGPGRAGGGEELGGLRGLSFYSQRVALHGDRAILDAVLAPR